MELMEGLDPEEARALVDPALKLMIDAVHRYDGYIVQSTGDGIFALFGAPTAHEDHPQRALYAALRMQEEMRRYAARLREAGNRPIEARVGVNTGEVVVRSLATREGHAEYAPIGHSTSLAARMQALAPTGSIAAADATRRLCEGYFTFKALGPTRVKGVTGTVNVYELTGLGPLRTHFQVSVRRGLTKFVGRYHELEQMKRALVLAKAGHGGVVAAAGDPGVGKSRLFYEFKAVVGFECKVLEAYSVSYGKASSYLPVIELLKDYFEIAPVDDERKRREKVNGKIITLDRSLEDTLSYLFTLLGLIAGDDPLAQMDPQIKRQRTHEAIKRILLRESLNQPLIIIFEDLHWIDSEIRELLNLLVDSLADARVLLLVNYRPEYRHEWGNHTYHTQLQLDPLGGESAYEMLSSLLDDTVELRPLRRLIAEKTEGNPFFIEEMVQSLFEEGALQRNGTVRLTRQLTQVRVPATVQAVLASRIDRLPAEEKDLLHTLAVLGREFPLDVMQQMAPAPAEHLERLLSRLQVSEFIYEQPALPKVEYIFKHALTQEVAYNSLLAERRKLLHERAGEAIEALFARRLEDHLVALAHHYERSANGRKAVEYLGRAGNKMALQGAHSEAVSYLSRAVELLEQLPDATDRARQELDLQIALGRSLIVIRGRSAPEREQVLLRAQELCEWLGENTKLPEVLLALALFRLYHGESRQALEMGQRALALAEQAKAQSMIAAAHCLLGALRFGKGEFESARGHLERADEFFGTGPYRDFDEALYARMALSYHSTALLILGYPETGLGKVEKLLTAARRSSDPYSIADALSLDANGRLFVRDEGAIVKLAHDLHSIAAEHGMPFYLARANFLDSWVTAAAGRPSEGIAQMRRAINDPNARGPAISVMITALADVCCKHGRVEEGLATVADGLRQADLTGDTVTEAELHRLRGELMLIQNPGSEEQAERYFRIGIDIARRQGARLFELRATTSLARLLARQGRRDEAHAMLADIYNWFTEGFDTADLKEAKALLDELSH
jgi:class 3 adenylate cyclase/tetratricopeptide (TPR) repeat protein